MQYKIEEAGSEFCKAGRRKIKIYKERQKRRKEKRYRGGGNKKGNAFRKTGK